MTILWLNFQIFQPLNRFLFRFVECFSMPSTNFVLGRKSTKWRTVRNSQYLQYGDSFMPRLLTKTSLYIQKPDLNFGQQELPKFPFGTNVLLGFLREIVLLLGGRVVSIFVQSSILNTHRNSFNAFQKTFFNDRRQ